MSEILNKIITAGNKGNFLELIVEDIFKDQNFSNVRKQKSGSQYGYDIIGYKEGKCWKSECKNLSSEATINDIAPKLVWHIDSLTIDKFVIVSVNGISNDLYHLLEQKLFSFPIEIWHSEYLEKIISESPNAMKRLGISQSEITFNNNSAPLVFSANDLKFDVVYSRGSPFSYDYFSIENEIIKAYSEKDFRLTATLNNPTKKTFIIQEITVKTLRYRSTDRIRVLRQFTQKGIIEPLKLTFIPKKYAFGETELNEGKLLEVKSESREYIEFKLSQKCEPGFYELLFVINCVEGARQFSLLSSIFSLHKTNDKEDIVNLNTINKFYDTPVDKILKLDEKTWNTIKKEYPNQLKYLGPTITDTPIGDTWAVNLLKGKRTKTDRGFRIDVSFSRKSTLLIDLGIPIEEKVYTKDDAMNDYLNSL